MRAIIGLIVVLFALFDMVLGFGFFLNPVSSGSGFGLTAHSPAGLSALRADFTAFFLVGAGFMIAGAWKQRGALLVAPLCLFLIAFTGRLASLVIDGTYDAWALPMIVEMAHIVLLALAIRLWPWQSVSAEP